MSECNDVRPPPPPPEIKEVRKEMDSIQNSEKDALVALQSAEFDKMAEEAALRMEEAVLARDEACQSEDLSLDDIQEALKIEENAIREIEHEKVEMELEEKKSEEERLALKTEGEARIEREMALEAELEEKERQRELDETLAEECKLLLGTQPDSHTLRLWEGAKKVVHDVFMAVPDGDRGAEIREPDIPWHQMGESTLLASALVAAMYGKHFGETLDRLKQSETFQSLMSQLKDQKGTRF
jgi:hypothetical protein